MDLNDIIESIEPGAEIELQDKPFINELRKGNLTDFIVGKTKDELLSSLETLAYLNMNADIVINRILWIIGEKRKTFYNCFVQPPWSHGYKLKPNDNYFFVQNMKKRGKRFNKFELFATIHVPDFDSIVRVNNLEYFKFMCKKYKSNIDNLCQDTLFKTNNMEMIIHAIEVGFKFCGNLNSAGNYSYEVLKFACDNFKHLKNGICQSCIDANNLEGLKYAIDDTVFNLYLSSCNDLETVKFLHDSGYMEICIYNYVGFNASPEVFKFMINNGYRFDDYNLQTIEMAECLMKNNIPFSNEMTEWVARAAKYDVLKFLIENKAPFEFDILCEEIACNDDFEMLKFIIENNYYLYPNNIGDKTIPPVICDEAARVGNVEMFKYLLDLGCNPTDRAINLACCNSKVEMVKYLCENGYKLESYLWDSCGNKDIKKLLKKYKCPIKTDS